jgi:hypothetical protein
MAIKAAQNSGGNILSERLIVLQSHIESLRRKRNAAIVLDCLGCRQYDDGD